MMKRKMFNCVIVIMLLFQVHSVKSGSNEQENEPEFVFAGTPSKYSADYKFRYQAWGDTVKGDEELPTKLSEGQTIEAGTVSVQWQKKNNPEEETGFFYELMVTVEGGVSYINDSITHIPRSSLILHVFPNRDNTVRSMVIESPEDDVLARTIAVSVARLIFRCYPSVGTIAIESGFKFESRFKLDSDIMAFSLNALLPEVYGESGRVGVFQSVNRRKIGDDGLDRSVEYKMCESGLVLSIKQDDDLHEQMNFGGQIHKTHIKVQVYLEITP